MEPEKRRLHRYRDRLTAVSEAGAVRRGRTILVGRFWRASKYLGFTLRFSSPLYNFVRDPIR